MLAVTAEPPPGQTATRPISPNTTESQRPVVADLAMPSGTISLLRKRADTTQSFRDPLDRPE
ncbi:hypothetical protein Aple_001150 [Acrocarpospora pleiomorpha]|uniref:Uncharacterized protein n=1 Tax=Acrocarpospora pleiomorpha TaxID=90975 RepID=A0A5M3X7Z5_9ACTN|nr:hypothetical protein [Acrocarpospora pleiomorpha]GES17220.1 hypothetical protein Aple_001150 [Acrocarpospora pleiomorpha]